MIYYNEIDAYAVQWLRNLGSAGSIWKGNVDERSIVDVRADDVRSFRQCHFFAGIGGWPHALKLAGWPEDREVWTGSCPCQPLSGAGQRKGHADKRHLWPAFYRLIAERRPAAVFGEQVASRDGREWLAGVRADLEGLGYAVGAADLCAAGVGAPHIRQRLFWVADAVLQRRQQDDRGSLSDESADGRQPNGRHISSSSGATDGLADADHRQRGEDRDVSSAPWQREWRGDAIADSGAVSGLGDAYATRSQGCGEHFGKHADQRSPWAAGKFISCLDGKARRIEPGVFPLADGVSARVGRLRAYGNAIIPQVAAMFIRAFMDCV